MGQKISAISALTGSISKKELEFGGHFYPLPVKDVSVGEIVLVHIWGMNTSPTDEKLGIWWKVTDPAGKVVEEYQDWQSFNTDPGGTHHFIGGRFTLSEEGRYMIYIELYIYNPDSWSFFKGKLATFVYSDYMELCSTIAIPEPLDWVLLGSANILVIPTLEIADWIELGSMSILVSPIPVAVDWVELGSASILVSPLPVAVDWVLLGSSTISVIPMGVEPPPMVCTVDADCPPGYICVDGKCVLEEEEKEFPWLWVAGGLGVAAVAVAATTKKKPAKGKKP